MFFPLNLSNSWQTIKKISLEVFISLALVQIHMQCRKKPTFIERTKKMNQIRKFF